MEKTEMMKRYEEKTGKQAIYLTAFGPEISQEYLERLEAKANISDEAIKAFQEIIRNQCDEISALKEKAEAYDSLMSGEPTAKEKIVDAIKAYRELCVCYRVGRQPSEKLFTRLKKADELLKTLEES